MTITFNEDQTAVCLYNELIDLRSLGTLSVYRISNIRFNEQSQRWEVWSLNNSVRWFEHESRAACVQWEHDHLVVSADGTGRLHDDLVRVKL